MQFSSVHIHCEAADFLKNIFQKNRACEVLNQELLSACGVANFFETQAESDEFGRFLHEKSLAASESDRAEYGDFQTNMVLANRVVDMVKQQGAAPDVLIEPTFGKGNFILAALRAFPDLSQIVGVEIYKPYVWEAKFAILHFFQQYPERPRPLIRLFHQDVFDFDFSKFNRQWQAQELLVLGNPPWVTNAKLGALNSDNLPIKSNFKNLNGLDAMTGKGNFDIGEYVTLMLLRAFHQNKGRLAFLVKNAVVKNLVFEQKAAPFRIGNLAQCAIDAKQEFGASVEASLFTCLLNQTPENQCSRSSIESGARTIGAFGWQANKFVSDLQRYRQFGHFDGLCPFEWRQGMKHDCSAVMEMDRVNGHFSSAYEAVVHLESDLVHGILKSSDLKGKAISTAKKYTIVTQKKVGQDTAYIKNLFPDTYRYLSSHQQQLAERKSSIYRGKPPFSIFGIGDYSFLPYKVAISGLYKSPVFTLVLPDQGKPLMLDDTCYFIGFEKWSDAASAFALLNHPFVTGLLESITFSDAKRVFTKDVLMRIDLKAVARAVDFRAIRSSLQAFGLAENLAEEDFSSFCQKLYRSEMAQPQLALF